jgi:hypothetical protein
MTHRSLAHRFLIHLLALTLPLVALPVPTAADNKSQITVNVGEPNVWSLGQAHYLLAQMRNKNQSWTVALPQFDPNATNGLRYDITRSFFGAEGQFNAVSGLQNSLSLQSFQQQLQRRQSLQTQADLALENSVRINREIANLDTQLAQLTGDDDDTKRRRAELTAAKEQKAREKKVSDDQLTALNTQIGSAPTPGTLNTALPLGTPTPTLPSKDDIATVFGKLPNIEKGDMPKISASIALDNIVNLQYEMIAKQLTLLRDEVRPGERLIFLEMPADLYSVPDKDDNFLLQMSWSVDGYVGNESKSDEVALLTQCRDLQQRNSPTLSNAPITRKAVDQFIKLQESLTPEELLAAAIIGSPGVEAEIEKEYGVMGHKQQNAPQEELKQQYGRRRDQIEPCKDLINRVSADIKRAKDDRTLSSKIINLGEFLKRYPSLRGKQMVKISTDTKKDPEANKFRVIDIIPRQSALNVNDTQAQQKGLALSAQFLSIFGMGGKVSYERQRTLYGQFIQQEIYASAFGKGTGKFGWTFGPLPGLKRLAPGVRTTFAVLAVPADATSFDLHVEAQTYHRKKSPNQDKDKDDLNEVANKTFRILVPGEETETFQVTGITYRPVRSGERVTAILSGRHFSPLTGVLVDGVPLKRAVSLANNENFTSASVANITDKGEYEYLSSSEIVMSFPAPATGYVGTPLITLVTPEKTATINSQIMDVNRERDTTLDERVDIEPMFLDSFRDTTKLQLELLAVIPTIPTKVELLLRGTGFHENGRVFINDEMQALGGDDAKFIDMRTVRLRVEKSIYDKGLKVAYRLDGKECSVIYTPPLTTATIELIANPATGKNEGDSRGGYDVLIRGKQLNQIKQVYFGDQRAPSLLVTSGDALLVKVPSGQAGTVYVLLFDTPPEPEETPQKGKKLKNGQAPQKAKMPTNSPANVADLKADSKAVFIYKEPPKEQKKPSKKQS